MNKQNVFRESYQQEKLKHVLPVLSTVRITSY
jgi:hypothetical protein